MVKCFCKIAQRHLAPYKVDFHLRCPPVVTVIAGQAWSFPATRKGQQGGPPATANPQQIFLIAYSTPAITWHSPCAHMPAPHHQTPTLHAHHSLDSLLSKLVVCEKRKRDVRLHHAGRSNDIPLNA